MIQHEHGSSAFNFLRNLCTLFYNGCTKLHSHQQCTRAPFSSHPHQNLLSVVFFIIAILTGVRWYLIAVFVCISVSISDAEYLLMYLLDICISSLEKYLFRSSVCILIGFFRLVFFFFFTIELVSSSYFWILTLMRYMTCKYFLPLIRLLLHSVNNFLSSAEAV